MRATFLLLIVGLFTASRCAADELGALLEAMRESDRARREIRNQGGAPTPDSEEYLRQWLDELLPAIDAYPRSPQRAAALTEAVALMNSLAARNAYRWSESIPFHHELLELLHEPEDRANALRQLGLALTWAAYEEKTYATQAVAHYDELQSFLESERLVAQARIGLPFSRKVQGQMYQLLGEHDLAARAFADAYSALCDLSPDERTSLRSATGPGGEFLLWNGALEFAQSGSPEAALELVKKLAATPHRKQPLGGIWSRLLDLDQRAFFEGALAWVLGIPDATEGPTGVIGRLIEQASHLGDEALVYELLTLQLDHYRDGLSESLAEILSRQREHLKQSLANDATGETVDESPTVTGEQAMTPGPASTERAFGSSSKAGPASYQLHSPDACPTRERPIASGAGRLAVAGPSETTRVARLSDREEWKRATALAPARTTRDAAAPHPPAAIVRGVRWPYVVVGVLAALGITALLWWRAKPR